MSIGKLLPFIFLFSAAISFGQQPKLILPIGHSQHFISQFSPDGKKILTLSLYEPSKLWDAATGKLLFDSVGFSDRINYACFSPDGKKIFTGYYGDSASIWDAASGKLLLRSIKGLSDGGIVRFSLDGKYLQFTKLDGDNKEENDSLFRIWDAASGKVVMNFFWDRNKTGFTRYGPEGEAQLTPNDLSIYLLKHPDSLFNAGFSAEGKKILTISLDGKVKIWNCLTGQLQATLSETAALNNSQQFSPDGKRILTYNSRSQAKIWDAESGRLLVQWNESPIDSSCGIFSPDGKKYMLLSNNGHAVIRDATNGRILFESKSIVCDYTYAQFLSGGDHFDPPVTGKEPPHKMADILDGVRVVPAIRYAFSLFFNLFFSSDGKKMIFPDQNFTGTVFDVSTGKILAILKGHTTSYIDYQFSADGSRLSLITSDTAIIVRDLTDGKFLFDATQYNPSLIDLSDDGKRFILTNKDHAVQLLDATSGKLLINLKKEGLLFNHAKLSQDGKKIMTFEYKGTIKLWDTDSGNLLAEIKGSEGFSSFKTKLSKDGEKIATIYRDTLKIIEISSNRLILRTYAPATWISEFSPDNKKILTVSSKTVINVWDISAGNLLHTFNTAVLRSIEFSKTGEKILVTTEDDSVSIREVSTFKLLIDLTDSNSWGVGAKFSRNGDKVIVVPRRGFITIRDVSTGKLLTRLKEATGLLYSAQAVLSPDEKRIITYWGDNTCRTWDAQTGELLYKTWGVDSTDHLVVDRYNRFDGTEAARKLLYFVCDDEIVDLDQVKDQLWVPNLAERINAGETINAITLSDLNFCGLTPQVENTGSGLGGYSFTIKPRRGGLGETVLYINGIEVRRYKPAELKKIGGNYELKLKKEELSSFFIAGKENPVTIKAYTSDNIISSRGAIVTADQTDVIIRPPNLYAVMVGVSDYKGTELDLKYAAKDATDISYAISTAAKKLLNTDSTDHVFMYNLTTARDHYLLPEKNSIKKALSDIGRKATANDILLVFFAGHGVMNGEGSKKQFYFLTSDASNFSATDAVRDVGISTSELIEWIKPQNIKAQKRILIFDACNSGQAINDFVKMGKEGQGYLVARNDEKAQQIKAIDKLNEKSGLFIFSASASNQSAYEMGRYSQGLLTYSLLKAIKQQPDILEDGKYLNVSRWFSAAEKTVDELSRENGARQEPQIVTTTNFNIGIVDDNVMAGIILPTEKPLFSSSNFQNSDSTIADDDLELSKLINVQLGAISSRGAESGIVFMTNTNSPDAWSLSGRYEITGNDVLLKASLKQNRVIKQRFEVRGTKDKLGELATLVAEKGAQLVK